MLRKYALIIAAAGGLSLTALATGTAGAAPAAPGLAPIVGSDVEVVRHRRCHVRRGSRWVRCFHRGPRYGPYHRGYYRPYRRWGPPVIAAPWPFWPFWGW